MSVYARMKALAPAVAATAVVSVAVATPAHAGIGTTEAERGPVIEANGGFPEWYEDGNGRRLELCLEGPFCIASAEPLQEPGQPLEFPHNFPPEGFWFEASTTMDLDGVPDDPLAPDSEFVFAQEAAFGGADEAIAPGNQIAFGRVRIRVFNGLLPGAFYRVTHPYGTDEFTAQGGARQINFSEDIGCVDLPCDFSLIGASRIGPTWLEWDVPDDQLPTDEAGNRYIGDPRIPHTVQGGPNGNIVRIERITAPDATGVPVVGPGALAAQTDLFTVQGRIADGPEGFFARDRGDGDFGDQRTGTSAARAITIRNGGSGPMSVGAMSLGGPDAADFAIATNACPASLEPAASCEVSVTFTPGADGARNATLDVVHNVRPGVNPDVTRSLALTGRGTPPPPVVQPTPQPTGGQQPAAPATATATPAAPPSGSTGSTGSAVDLFTSPLALDRLITSSRVRRSRARGVGLRLVMGLREGTEVVQVRIYRRTSSGRKLISSGFRSTNGRTGLFRMRQNHRSLRRSLKIGRYELEVTPGSSRTDLGQTSRYNVTVVR